MRRASKKIFLGITVVILLFLLFFVVVAKHKTVSVRFIMPDGEKTLFVKPGKEFEFPSAYEYDGYSFLRWEDMNGVEVHSPGLVWDDTSYVAKYGMAFDKDVHLAFMSADNSFFRPDDALTVREAVNMLYTLLNTELEGTSTFIDVDINDELYKPASLLKDLGVIQGNYLHPDDYMTKREFADLLSNFYPYSSIEKFSNSEELLTRETAAVIMCSLLDRYGDANHDFDKVGELSDVPTTNENYWCIAEACIPHESEGSGVNEVWTNSVPCLCTENGFYFSGYDLHYIDNKGAKAANTKIGNIEFDENGIWTSGDKSLDLQIRQILKEHVDPSKQTRIEMLRILYNHVRDDYDYCYGQDYLPGQTGWANAEALKMIDRKLGNCYRFAGLFAVLARSIGFDAEECCGVLDKDSHLHSWVEINIDGVQYLFDPQYESRFPAGQEEYDRFMKTGDIFDRYNAMREYRDKYN